MTKPSQSRNNLVDDIFACIENIISMKMVKKEENVMKAKEKKNKKKKDEEPAKNAAADAKKATADAKKAKKAKEKDYRMMIKILGI